MRDRGRDALDAMLTDVADEQRNRGLIPDVTNAKSYLVPIVDRAARKADQPKPTKPEPAAPQQDKVLAEAERRGVHGKWSIDRRVPSGVSKKLTRIEQRLRKRIRLLASKPDWAAKLKELNPLALAGTLGEERRRHAAHLVMEIINDSDRVFGPWNKERARKLYSK